MSTRISVPEGQQDRKDFSEWQVTAAWIAQEGVCYNFRTNGCSNPLDQGFARHHKDENHANNATENLALLCPECHRATLKGNRKVALDKHREYEQQIFNKLNEAIDQTLLGKLSGASAERLLDAISLGLKMSHQGNHVDEDIERVPLSIRMAFKNAEREISIETYLEGFKDCLRTFNISFPEHVPHVVEGPFGRGAVKHG